MKGPLNFLLNETIFPKTSDGLSCAGTVRSCHRLRRNDAGRMPCLDGGRGRIWQPPLKVRGSRKKIGKLKTIRLVPLGDRGRNSPNDLSSR